MSESDELDIGKTLAQLQRGSRGGRSDSSPATLSPLSFRSISDTEINRKNRKAEDEVDSIYFRSTDESGAKMGGTRSKKGDYSTRSRSGEDEEQKKLSKKPKKVTQDHSSSSATAPVVAAGRGAKATSSTSSGSKIRADMKVAKRKKDLYSDSSNGGNTGDESSNLAELSAKKVSTRRTGYQKSSSTSLKKVKSKKEFNGGDIRKARATKPKATQEVLSSSTTSTAVAHKTTTSTSTRGGAAESTSDERPMRKCHKEGCNKELVGRHKNRCEEHVNLCKRANCWKGIRRKGLCHRHDTLDKKGIDYTTIDDISTSAQSNSGVKPVTKCQKEECNVKLKRNQSTRCEEHRDKCKRKNCNKGIKNYKKGVCSKHDIP